MNQPVPVATKAPAPVVASGNWAAYGFLESFSAQIRNPHFRRV